MGDLVETLERHQHASHMAQGHGGAPDEHGGLHMSRSAQWSALLVAVLAAGLAISEQGARHAEIRVQQRSIDAADAWAQYQAKSTRGTVAKDAAALLATLDPASDPALRARREQVIAQLNADQDGYEHDPKDGKEAIAHRAHGFEHARDHSVEQAHAYHNGSASYQLGIVLTTAAAIIRARPLVYVAVALGLAGIVLSVLGYVAPEYGAL